MLAVLLALSIAPVASAAETTVQTDEPPQGGFFAEKLHRPLVVTDLNDELYDYLSMWDDKGYLSRPLPYFRPYPQQVIKAALEDVRAQAPSPHAERAQNYLRHIDREPQAHLRGEHLSEVSNDGDYFGLTGAAVESSGYLLENLTISGSIGAYLIDENEVSDDVYPTAMRATRDFAREDSRMDALGREYLITLGVNGMLGFGSESTYAQAGLSRGTYGPFYDSGAILSPGAPHHGQFAFTHRSDHFTYQHVLMALTAGKDDGTTRDHERDGSDFVPNKFVAFHALTFHMFDWLDISLHESITYGQRFDPVYLLPTSVLIYNQIYYGEQDSAFVGFTANARLPHDLAASTTLYVGDVDFKGMLRGDLSGKYKAGWQTGARWTPMRGMLERVTGDYTLVLPYTYTHRRKAPGDGSLYDVGYDDATEGFSETPEVNYQNYTHHGQSLVDLDPNSDRLRLQTRLRPGRFVTVKLQGAFLRHANATPEGAYDGEAGEDIGTSDGSVNDPGYRSEQDNLYDELNFLNQDVIERIIQLGFDTEISVPVEVEWLRASRGHPGVFSIDFGYTFEYGWNRRPRGEGEWITNYNRDHLNRPEPEEGNHGARHYGRFGFSLAY